VKNCFKFKKTGSWIISGKSVIEAVQSLLRADVTAT
jgi:hypothetical protein